MGSIEKVKGSDTKSEFRTLQVDDIPNCSTNDQLILEIITDDNVDLEQLAMFIAESPSLSATIIGLANSAYFSAPTTIYSVSDAIIKVLGMRMVRSIALSVVLGRSLDLSRCPGFSVIDYWADALTVARYCQILTINSDFKKLVSSDQIYLSALLSNFGRLVLIHHFPGEMSEIITGCEGDLLREIEQQQIRLGMTQSEAGVLLGRRWHLPTLVINTMHYCLTPDYQGQDWSVARVVGEVTLLTNQVTHGGSELALSPQVEKLLQLPADQCNLQELTDLRKELLTIAQHLKIGG
ncbi:MAG: HD-like signal output (HDOD) protein [Candidatus Azotimanducaceae bacterium]|jgi:HD-like signal output (HDOD) protein